MELDKTKVHDDETLYRMIKKSNPDVFIDGKPTAALFIDDKGMSVDRDGNRMEEKIINNFKKRFRRNDDFGGAVKITAGECREIGTYPIPKETNSNRYHAEVHESDTVIEISLLKAVMLAEKCMLVEKSI